MQWKRPTHSWYRPAGDKPLLPGDKAGATAALLHPGTHTGVPTAALFALATVAPPRPVVQQATAALLCRPQHYYTGGGGWRAGARGGSSSPRSLAHFFCFFVADMKERRGASFKQAVKVEEEQQGSESRNLVVGNY